MDIKTGRPDLVVRQDDLTATARDLAQIIARSGRVYDRAGPVKVLTTPSAPLPQVQHLTRDRVVIEAHDLARPVEIDHEPYPVTLPERVAKLHLALDDWGLAPLKGLTTAPLLAADGTMRSAHGYDPASAMWCYNVPPLAVPPAPNRTDAECALQSLRTVFRTFPFADAPTVREPDCAVPVVDLGKPPSQDESSFLTALLTAVCRPSLSLAPGPLISAPSITGAGSGKGLLVRAICEIAFGHPPDAFTGCRDVAEFEKRISAALIEATPVLFIDNVNGTVLRSDLLASILTEPSVRVRRLGESRMLPLNPTALVTVTGNGLTLGEDLVRRFVTVELDPRTDDPESRPFAPGFISSVSERRAELLTAALTIWRWGRQSEHEIPHGRPLGSYETWARWVRDPLLALGCADPVERITALKARDPERQRIAAMFAAWQEHHEDRPVRAAQLCDQVRDLIDPQGRGRQYVASALEALAGTRASGFVLTQQDPPGKWSAATYALRPVAASQGLVDSPMTPMVPMVFPSDELPLQAEPEDATVRLIPKSSGA